MRPFTNYTFGNGIRHIHSFVVASSALRAISSLQTQPTWCKSEWRPAPAKTPICKWIFSFLERRDKDTGPVTLCFLSRGLKKCWHSQPSVPLPFVFKVLTAFLPRNTLTNLTLGTWRRRSTQVKKTIYLGTCRYGSAQVTIWRPSPGNL